ncbi:MAG: hypothetical protein ACUVWV_05045 [Thermodesulfobacteriota bacterium]
MPEIDIFYRGQLKNAGETEYDSTVFSRFSTSYDLLGIVENGNNYGDLLLHSSEIEINQGRFKVLALEKLIEVKGETGFE